MLCYANHFSLSVNDRGTEFILQFNQRFPNVTEDGGLSGYNVENMAKIVLNKDGFEALKALLTSSAEK